MAIVKKRLKILLYGNVFGAYRSQNLFKYLLDSGYRISFISPEFFYELGEKKNLLTKALRILLSSYYLVDLFVQAALADVIYLLPLNSNLITPVIWASRLFKTKLIVEMYISAYDTRVREKQEVAADSKSAQLLFANDRLALSAADRIIHLSRYELSYWENIFDIKLVEDKIAIAPLFCESKLTEYQHNTIQDNCLRICWWGTLIPSHGIPTILEALHKLQNNQVKFSCQLFGIPPKGREYLLNTYETKIEELGLKQVVTLRQDLKFTDDSLPRYLVENCDLALGIFGDTEKARAAVPNKLIESLTLCIPTLTMSTPALKEFFDPDVDFWSCEASPEVMADTITQIYKKIAYQVDWNKTREKVLQTFSVRNYHQSITQVLNSVKAELIGDK
ncbi:glycosyl transferase group 1 [Leptolyngbya sp. PCC 7375]|nr:glycosyl transferase group 1 [Leptolyngbya sp. PCC 7375]